MFVKFGVSGENELGRRLDLTRSGENQTLEELFEEWKATARFLLSQRPEWMDNARHAIESASFAELVPTKGATNGSGG